MGWWEDFKELGQIKETPENYAQDLGWFNRVASVLPGWAGVGTRAAGKIAQGGSDGSKQKAHKKASTRRVRRSSQNGVGKARSGKALKRTVRRKVKSKTNAEALRYKSSQAARKRLNKASSWR